MVPHQYSGKSFDFIGIFIVKLWCWHQRIFCGKDTFFSLCSWLLNVCDCWLSECEDFYVLARQIFRKVILLDGSRKSARWPNAVQNVQRRRQTFQQLGGSQSRASSFQRATHLKCVRQHTRSSSYIHMYACNNTCIRVHLYKRHNGVA